MRALGPGGEIILTDNDRRAARITPDEAVPRPRPRPGACARMLTVLAEDGEHVENVWDHA